MLKVMLATIVLFLAPVGIEAADVPVLKGRINDYANVLDAHARVNLESRLAAYEKETAHQIAVLTVPSLGGEAIEAFSLRVANTWALGRKDLDNGVLLLVVPNERKLRIELGKQMAGHVSNAQTSSIIADMLVQFRKGDLGGGIELGVTQLMKECRAYKIQISKSSPESDKP
jgi:uncharacterized protein